MMQQHRAQPIMLPTPEDAALKDAALFDAAVMNAANNENDTKGYNTIGVIRMDAIKKFINQNGNVLQHRISP